MKTIILAAILTLSSSAFATHAYRAMDCSSASYNLTYKGNYPMGGAYELSKNDLTTGVELFEADSETDTSFRLEFADTKIISTDEIKAECKASGDIEFDEQVSTMITKIKITKLTAEEEKNLGLKSGSVLKMQCLQKLSLPVNCE